MNKYDLSILIPARNEMFLKKTIENILENIEGNTEIIVVLDGEWAEPGLEKHERVTVVYHPVSIGQRAATNEAAKLSQAKYIMKLDAHCSFDKGFDVKMMAEMKDDWTMAPLMKNLHGFDWVCEDGHRRYQGPSGVCRTCGKPETKDILWKGKNSPNSVSYCFDSEPHFQYFGEFSKRPEGRGDITPSMSLQGSCFMCTREKYWELGLCDEAFGSWGSQGIEVACKTWLSGGQVMVNKKTWYAHLFRTQGADFGFPYPNSGAESAKAYAKDLFFNNKWDKAVYPLSWLLEKFWPVKGWSEENLIDLKSREIPKTKGIIYYTDNKLDEKIEKACQNKLEEIGLPIVSVSLKPINFGKNIVLPLERGHLTMFKQILTGLEKLDTDIVYFCEHDVLYNKSHFDFTPSEKDIYYYNTNIWKLRDDGFSFRVDDCKQLSGLVVYREQAIKHYKERIRRVELEGFGRNNGFEPGTRSIRRGGYDDNRARGFESSEPLIDIRHDTNLTKNRWSKEEFRNPKYTVGWKESYDFKDKITWQ